MKLRDKLIEETILVPMQATSKESANKELLTHLKSKDIISSTVKLVTNIKEQENIFTASEERGVAYPHATCVEVNKLICALGISTKGIDFNLPDGQDYHLILLTLCSADDPAEHRKFISRFQFMVQNPVIRSRLNESESRDEILNIISHWEEDENLKGDML